MARRIRSERTRQRQRLHERLCAIEADLEERAQRLSQLENTLRHVVRIVDDVSIGGPCKCGESLLIVRQRSVYCPECSYRRTV